MILLKNGTYIDWQTLEFSNMDILVEEGKSGGIQFVTHHPEKEHCQTVDCSGKYITKSFANGHHHAYSGLARGMPAPEKSPENFMEILKYIWWNLDKALDTEMIRASALVTALECAKNGSTFVIDHHASPIAIKGSLETIADSFDQVGVSHLLCYEISDRDGIGIAESGLQETAEFLSNHQGLVGLHASFTVGYETLGKAVSLAEKYNSGIHIHVAEDQVDQQLCMTEHQCRVVERLDGAGVLQFPKTILAHCLHLNEHERDLIKSSPAWVVENMDSNLNNRVGFFNGKGLGNKIMLGTDGMHSDMLRSAASAFFAGQGHEELNYEQIYLRFRNAHRYLSINGFAGDGDNNLVILDYPSPTPFNPFNFFGHFLFGIGAGHVRHVISKGKLIVQDGRITTINEKDVLEYAKDQALRLWSTLQKRGA